MSTIIPSFQRLVTTLTFSRTKLKEYREVFNKIEADVVTLNREIQIVENRGWSGKLDLVVLCLTREGLIKAKKKAQDVLDKAIEYLRSASYLTNQANLETSSAKVAIEESSARKVEEALRKGFQQKDEAIQAAINLAQELLATAQIEGQAVVNHAIAKLEEAKNASPETLAQASALKASLETCAEWVEYTAAKADLKIEESVVAGAILLIKAGIPIATKLSETKLHAWQLILTSTASFINITKIKLEMTLGVAANGFPFEAEVQGTMVAEEPQPFTFKVMFDTKDEVAFLRALFDK